MEKSRQKQIVDRLLEEHGETFAEEAGIHVENTPAPLFQLLVLSILSSARISAGKATGASRALFDYGLTSASRMEKSSWDERAELLNEHGYARYDESAARMLGQSNLHLQRHYRGDLRRLRESAGKTVSSERELLQEFKGIGPVGADIFLREVQIVWPEVHPFVDERATQAAERIGIPKTGKTLSGLVKGPKELTRLVSALVRFENAKQSSQRALLKSA